MKNLVNSEEISIAFYVASVTGISRPEFTARWYRFEIQMGFAASYKAGAATSAQVSPLALHFCVHTSSQNILPSKMTNITTSRGYVDRIFARKLC
jgi:hypothetical protein